MEVGNKRALVALSFAVTMAGGVVGTAVAAGTDPKPQVRSAAEVYKPGMTLKEVQVAASGKIGQVAPPCPDEKAVMDLKAAGLPFGPCDLVPEEGKPFIIPDPAEELPELQADGEVCSAVLSGKSDEIRVSLPCAPGAEITEVQRVEDGTRSCARVVYVAHKGVQARSETVCDGQTTTSRLAVTRHLPDEHSHE